MNDPHWYDRLPPLALLVIALGLIAFNASVSDSIQAAVLGLAGVLVGAAIVLETVRVFRRRRDGDE